MSDPDRVARLVADELDAAYRRRVRTVLEWIDPGPADLVLDAGCGRGFYPTFVRAVSDARVVGADLRLADLSIAARTLATTPGVDLVRADLRALPFAPGAFSAAIASEVLEHIDDDVGALGQIARAVRPGGRIAITVPNAAYPFWWDPVNRFLESTVGRPVRRGPLAGIWTDHVRLYTPAALRSVAERAGLEVVDERSCTHRCVPFMHNLLYGLGKPLYDSGLLPSALQAAGDRHRPARGRGGALNPMRWALAIVDLFDRDNPPSEPPDRSSVNLCLLARRPPEPPR